MPGTRLRERGCLTVEIGPGGRLTQFYTLKLPQAIIASLVPAGRPWCPPAFDARPEDIKPGNATVHRSPVGHGIGRKLRAQFGPAVSAPGAAIP
jgi:hypothetical protein